MDFLGVFGGRKPMRSYFRILVLVSLFLPARVFGSWGFSAQLYENNCITTIPLTLPAISGFPNQSMCNAVRAEVLAIQESAPWEKAVGRVVGYLNFVPLVTLVVLALEVMTPLELALSIR